MYCDKSFKADSLFIVSMISTNLTTKHIKTYSMKLGLFAQSSTLLILIGIQMGCMTNVEEISGRTQENVSFSEHIQPVLNQYCVSCHGNQAGVNLESYQTLMSSIGSKWNNQVVVPGSAATSGLYDVLLSNPQKQIPQMPIGGPYLTGDEIEAIKAWINEGANDN